MLKSFLTQHIFIKQTFIKLQSHSFKTLNGIVSSSSTHSINYDFNEKLLATLSEREKYAANGGGEKSIIRHTIKNGKLLVQDRIHQLIDSKTDFLELSKLCGLGLYGTDVQSGGVVCGIGQIHGRDVMIVASDATVSAGAMYPITVRKQLRAQEIAHENKLPVFYIVDSAGGFLPMQSDLFADRDHGGRAFYNQARMSSENIPQIAIVPGSCTAGGAYMCTMSDEAIIVKDLGYVYLGGPPLVKAATGEIVSDKELGGAEVHCELSGCTDHYADDEQDALEIARSIGETLPLWKKGRNDDDDDDDDDEQKIQPLHSMEDISNLIPCSGSKQPLPIHQILARLLDKSEFHEHRAKYGKTLICGFGRVGNELIGIIANQGPLIGGAADEEPSASVKVGASHSPAALKGTHFIQLCNSRNVPLVFLADIWNERDDGISNKRLSSVAGAVKDVSGMIKAIATAKVPKITINVGEYGGSTAYAMGGRTLGSSFVFSWPNATISMGSGGGDDGGGDNPVRDAFYSTARVWDDGIIAPVDTRQVLKRVLRIVNRNRGE